MSSSLPNPAEVPPSPPLVVPELRDRCMGSAEIATLILEKLEAQLRRDLPELENGLRAGDMRAIAQTAHAMKGAAGAAAAPVLRDLAADIEQQARNQALESLTAALQGLKSEIDRCIGFLPRAREEIRRGAPGGSAAEERS